MSSTIQRQLLTRISAELKERTPENIELPSTIDGYVDGISEMYTHLIVLINDLLLNDIEVIKDFASDIVERVELKIINGFFAVELYFDDTFPDFNIFSGLFDMVLESTKKTSYPTRFKETIFNNLKK